MPLYEIMGAVVFIVEQPSLQIKIYPNVTLAEMLTDKVMQHIFPHLPTSFLALWRIICTITYRKIKECKDLSMFLVTTG